MPLSLFPSWIVKQYDLTKHAKDGCDVGVKYVDKVNVNHLIASIETMYTLTEDWTGNLYCGIKLGWDYKNRTINISMPGYIQKKLEEYEHIHP